VQEWERNILWEKWQKRDRERLSEQKQEMDTSIRMIEKNIDRKKENVRTLNKEKISERMSEKYWKRFVSLLCCC